MKDRPQLFCFSYAGGTTEFFDGIEKNLPGIELVKLEYAGHGQRHKEEFYKDFEELAEDMFFKLKDRYSKDIPYALFGYSMGSISAVEVLKKILTDPSMPLPTHVFLAAHEPHTKEELLGYTADELDSWVKERTIRFGAVPEKLKNNQVFWRTYLPIYRADYAIIGKYRFERLNLNTKIPAVIFYSETDTPWKDMKQWNQYFVGDCEFYPYSGTHFFIRDHHSEVSEVILEKMGVPL